MSSPCRSRKPLSPAQKTRLRKQNRAWRLANPEKRKATQRKWRLKNIERINGRNRKLQRTKYRQARADWRRKHKYGLTRSEFRTMLGKQEGLCAICTAVLGSGHKTHIDHDHATGTVRALLCGHCNKGLGSFRDNPALLTGAVAYLRLHQAAA